MDAARPQRSALLCARLEARTRPPFFGVSARALATAERFPTGARLHARAREGGARDHQGCLRCHAGVHGHGRRRTQRCAPLISVIARAWPMRSLGPCPFVGFGTARGVRPGATVGYEADQRRAAAPSAPEPSRRIAHRQAVSSAHARHWRATGGAGTSLAYPEAMRYPQWIDAVSEPPRRGRRAVPAVRRSSV